VRYGDAQVQTQADPSQASQATQAEAAGAMGARASSRAMGTCEAPEASRLMNEPLPNKRLKLAAPGLKGIIMFVIIRAARRSLSATR